MRISSCWVIFYHLWNWVKFIFEDKNLYFFKLKFIIVLLCENKQEKKFRRFSFLWRNFLFHVFSRRMIVNTHTHRGCVCVCSVCEHTHIVQACWGGAALQPLVVKISITNFFHSVSHMIENVESKILLQNVFSCSSVDWVQTEKQPAEELPLLPRGFCVVRMV